MKISGFLIIALATLLPVLGLMAQSPSAFALQNSPAYEEAADVLRNAPPRQYEFNKAILSDVLRFLADDAGISFLGLPEGVEGADRLVSFSLRTSPFTALETLAKANGISLIFESGLWYLRPANDTELIGRVYAISYNSQEMVKKSNTSSGLGIAGGSGLGGGGGTSGISLQGAPDTFEREPSKLIEDIRSILGLATTSSFANIAPAATVDTLAQLSARSLLPTADPRTPLSLNGGSEVSEGETENGARVIWNSDTNSLYVVATRQHHQWIEAYLEFADRPQPSIAVEVKFLELNKDPRIELGVDWTGTLDGGYGAVLEIPPSEIDLNRIKDYRLPTDSILTWDEVNLRLRALLQDRRTRQVSYPRMLTLDNREVVFRSVINQPVLASSSSTSLGAGATQTSAVDYLPIGTVINILPKTMANDVIQLNVSITISDIIGTEFINGNPFPIASSRVYTAPIQVESGYTVAISGLDAQVDEREDQGVPFLSRIPVLGYAFKYKDQGNSHQHLMMLITPTLISSSSQGGVSERPVTTQPGQQILSQRRAVSYDPLPPLPAGPPMIVEPLVPAGAGKEVHPYYQGAAPAGPAAPPVAAVPGAVEPEPAEDIIPLPIIPAPVDLTQDQSATPAPAPAEFTAEPLPVTEFQNDGGQPPVSEQAALEPSPAPAPDLIPDTGEIPAENLIPDGEGLRSDGANTESRQMLKRYSPISWQGEALSGGRESIDDAVDYLQTRLAAVESSAMPDPLQVREIQAESQKLLDYIDGAKTEESDLSAEWWSLVRINGQTRRLGN